MGTYQVIEQEIAQSAALRPVAAPVWSCHPGHIRRGRSLLWMICLLGFLLPLAAQATIYNVKPTDKLFDILGKLKAGDEVIVAAGTYSTPGFLTYTWSGTQQQPIVIRAAAGARPIIKGVPNQNVMNLNGSYFTLRGFEIIDGSHGIRLYKVAHILLEDLKIHDVKDVGISCNAGTSDCDDVTLRGNEIYKTGGHGEGMYLGCNSAGCVMRNSLIELNYIHDLGGDQGDGIEMKTGSYGNIIRDNVIVNARYPAITMYGYQEGAGRKPNIVERNLIWKTVDNGIQIVGQVIVRNNIIVDAGGNGIHSKPSQGFNAYDIKILHNTIYNAGGACLKTNNWTGQKDQLVANNAFYCPGKSAMDINGGAPTAQFFNNVILGNSNYPKGTLPAGTLKGDLGDPAARLFYPPPGSKLLDAGDPKYGTLDDFDGRTRTDGKPDVGAYERSGAAPLWKIVFGFKPAPPSKPQPPVEMPPQEPPPGEMPLQEKPAARELPPGTEPPVGQEPPPGQEPVEEPATQPDASGNVDVGATDNATPTPEQAGGLDTQPTTPDTSKADGQAGDTSGTPADNASTKGGCGCHSQEPPLAWLSLFLLACLLLRRPDHSKQTR